MKNAKEQRSLHNKEHVKMKKKEEEEKLRRQKDLRKKFFSIQGQKEKRNQKSSLKGARAKESWSVSSTEGPSSRVAAMVILVLRTHQDVSPRRLGCVLQTLPWGGTVEPAGGCVLVPSVRWDGITAGEPRARELAHCFSLPRFILWYKSIKLFSH